MQAAPPVRATPIPSFTDALRAVESLLMSSGQRTARRNAWTSVLEDRRRAKDRVEAQRVLERTTATGRPVPGMSSAPASSSWTTDGMLGAWATDSGTVRPQETAGRSPEVPARPPLPRRQPQASPILPAPDKRGDGSTTRSPEPPADQMTGLMADFLRGVRSAEEADPSTEG